MTETGRGIVAWADTDASGWIHFAAPMRWVEELEHRVLRAAGVDPGTLPRRAVEARYERSLRAGQEYFIELTAERVGGSSITYSWVIRSDDAVRVVGRHTAVHVGSDGRPAPLPEALRESWTER